MSTPTILQPSLMSLLLQMRAGGEIISSGTGFVVPSGAGPLLVTNWHNVTGRRPDNDQALSPTGRTPDELIIWHNSRDLGTWVPRLEPLNQPGGGPRWVEHPTLGRRVDVVALPLRELEETQLFPHSLDAGAQLAWGPAEPISVVGFPFGLTAGGMLAIWATGFVASEPELNWNDLPVFLIDCRARPGQSGSAVIICRDGTAVRKRDSSVAMTMGPVWELVGIYSGRLNDQSDLGIVWKTGAISDVVRAAEDTLRPATALPPADELQHEPEAHSCACGSGRPFSRCHGTLGAV